MKKLFILTAFFFIGQHNLSAQWTKVAPIPTGPTAATFSWTIGKKIFVSGGSQSQDLWEYDAVADKWTSKGKMGGNMFHTQGMAFAANGKGYIIGGDTAGAGSTSAAIWEYEPNNNKWTYKGAFPGGKRKNAFCFSINNIAYLGGGFDEANNAKNDFYRYDPVANKWQSTVALPMGYISSAATFVVNGKAYVCGGQEYVPSIGGLFESRNWVWEYDPVGPSWKAKKDMPHDRIMPFGFTVGNKGYVFGGSPNFTSTVKTITIYDPVANSWSAGDDYPIFSTALATGFVVDTTYYIGAGSTLNGGGGVTPTDAFYRHGPAPTSVSNIIEANNTLQLYPNPANSSVSIQGVRLKDITAIYIYNTTGALVDAITSPVSTEVQVAAYPAGMYYLDIQTQEGKLTGRFIKQ